MPRISLLLLAAFVVPSAYSQAAPSAGLHCSLHVVSHTDADKLLISGSPAQARELFTAQLAAQPSVPNYTGLVDTQLAQDDFPAAQQTAQRAATAFPNSADALALTGDALLRAGQVPEAFTAYTRALTLDQCSYRAHLGMGRLDEFVSRHASAMHELTLAHKLAPPPSEMAET